MHDCFHIYIPETTARLDKVLAFERKYELAQALNTSHDVELSKTYDPCHG